MTEEFRLRKRSLISRLEVISSMFPNVKNQDDLDPTSCLDAWMMLELLIIELKGERPGLCFSQAELDEILKT